MIIKLSSFEVMQKFVHIRVPHLLVCIKYDSDVWEQIILNYKNCKFIPDFCTCYILGCHCALVFIITFISNDFLV